MEDEINEIYGSLEFNWTSEKLNSVLKEHNTSIDNVLLNLLKNSYKLTDNEINFVKYNSSKFQDTISMNVNYFGDENKYFNFGTKYNGCYNWIGDNTCRYGIINYIDGSYAHEVGKNSA